MGGAVAPHSSHSSVAILKISENNRIVTKLSLWSSAACCCCRHYWAFKVEPFSYMVKVGVASDSKLLEWFHSPRDTSSPR